LRSLRSIRSVPFFCGVIHYDRDGLFAQTGWAWPLSRVDLRESDLHAYTPVLYGRWTLEVPYGEIDEAVLRHYRWGGKIRLRRNHGDVSLTTMGGNYVRIANLLRDKGVLVTAEEGSAVETP
jgi:hypothetical protein